jgi:hypothetical protein
MPKGMDTRNHGGRSVHRDTPRIAARLADWINETAIQPLQNAFDEVSTNSPLYADNEAYERHFEGGDYPEEIDEYKGQDLINQYRKDRDRGMDVGPYADEIGNAIRGGVR